MNFLPYAGPMALFLALTTVEGYLPKASYPWAYGVKIVAVTVALLMFRKAWREEIHFDARVLLPALAVGLVTFAQWVWLDKAIPYPPLGSRVGFDPNAALPDPLWRGLFVAVRLYGLALVVPVMEEVFWRSFLLRYATDQDKWRELPVGQFSLAACLIVAGLFAVAHPEWLVAAVCALLYAALLWHTKSLFACIVAHATTNLALGIYVLATGDWKYW
jgi:uncharacterized protein